MKALTLTILAALSTLMLTNAAQASSGQWEREVLAKVAATHGLEIADQADLYANICGETRSYSFLRDPKSSTTLAAFSQGIPSMEEAADSTEVSVKLLNVETCAIVELRVSGL